MTPKRTFAEKLVVRIPCAWLVVFFLVPFLIVLRISLSQPALAQPPYTPLFDLLAGWHGIAAFFGALSLDNYALIGSDPIYLLSFVKSVEIAAFSTLFLLVIGYPIAYGITRTPRRVQAVLMTLVMLPFWTAFLIRIYAWMNILQHDGPLNQLLMALHIVSTPPVWLSTDTAIYIGIVYSYLPFMVLPLYAALEKLDEIAIGSGRRSRLPARQDLLGGDAALVGTGRAGRRAAMLYSCGRRVRHSRPARRLPGADDRADHLDGIFRQQGLAGRRGRCRRADRRVGDADCHFPAPDDARRRARLIMRKVSTFNLTAIVLGLAFLYLPIAVLVIYSFNASRLVAVWGGWSTRWYAELINDAPLLDSAFISIRLALVSATAATILGTLAAVALVRFGRFRGRLLFASMIYAPLVMPEVVTGLSMLLLFVAVAIDRGFWTVAIAHTTMAMCFVTVIVQARLIDFDMNLEEAAMDLGASPLETFRAVTLPLILPAIAAGWMLAFALSLDDLVTASFTTGPGATTLPIRIYSEVRLGVKPEMNAVCSIMIGVVGLAVIAASLLAKFSIVGRSPTTVP